MEFPYISKPSDEIRKSIEDLLDNRKKDQSVSGKIQAYILTAVLSSNEKAIFSETQASAYKDLVDTKEVPAMVFTSYFPGAWIAVNSDISRIYGSS